MAGQPQQRPTVSSVELAMDQAWRDHHHARDQTWKALQMVAVLAAGMVSVDIQYKSVGATLAAAVLVALAAIVGMWITLRHRELERQKFRHILNCEEFLGLHRDDLIPLKRTSGQDPEGAVKLPRELKLWHVFHPGVHATAAFILRMHVALMIFSIVVAVSRWVLA